MRRSQRDRYQKTQEALEIGERRLALIERIVFDVLSILAGLGTVVLTLLFGLRVEVLPAALLTGFAAFGSRRR